MKRLRQIVTKAVIAKGKKRTESSEVLRPPNTPTSILGCWVINHHYSAKKVGKYVEVSGKYDVNVWYAYNNHSKTAVYSETIPYKDRIKLHYRDEEIIDSNEVHVKVLQQPNCIEAIINQKGDCFNIVIEREFLVELIGETKIVVSVHPIEFEEEWNFDDAEDEDESSSSSSSSSSSDFDYKESNRSDSSSFQ
ncbi:outer spore coat protein CotE [Ureibacillus thermophilus]|uniref:Outer spore coat protein CotE n=1 Tax=Ureibacillus thermophilus TaxID=367743 RepID=A0A4V1A319_9BACL|nr:outer spore coat protein CotE [Ureibacillus thermophilus]QBK25710.1 outer spore coat protein CotE [Ureibacillus thermophilus]